MVSTPIEWPAFEIYLNEILKSKDLFLFFSISYVSYKANAKTDMLARSTCVHPQDIMYVNDVLVCGS